MSRYKSLIELATKRALKRCDELAKISQHKNKITRLYLTPEHKKANKKVAQWMQMSGMKTWQDKVGNQCGRIEGRDKTVPALLLGSHLDTVPNAGRYDGILGVLLAIELVDLITKTNIELRRSIEVIGFCDEEGVRFGKALIGSLSVAGCWQDSWLALTDRDEITLKEAMLDFGLYPKEAVQAKRDSTEFDEYWEVHIEQGPVLEAEQLPVGIVTGIAGARRGLMEITGRSGHSGTTPMRLRRDALCCASEITLAIEHLALTQATDAVATVGKLSVKPGAVNVTPGNVCLSLDVRASDDCVRDEMIKNILAKASSIAKKRNTSVSIQWEHSAPAVLCADTIQQRFALAASKTIDKCRFLPSGAGHDAMAIAEICPVGMLFIRSPEGLSHHPDEAVIETDVFDALNTLYESLLIYNSELDSLTHNCA